MNEVLLGVEEGSGESWKGVPQELVWVIHQGGEGGGVKPRAAWTACSLPIDSAKCQYTHMPLALALDWLWDQQ